ncbi:hypothetical protein SANTM175S_00398 [Streptomyces antimycoticus]
MAVEASGVSFAEQQMRRGKYYDRCRFPFVPGYDLVGTVVSTGPGVDPALRGRRFAALTKIGGWASHTLVDAGDLVEVPEGVDAAEAETVVVNGITAWQMLHRVAKVRPGMTVLVHGANGGVGTTLVQLARHAGVKVIGTASPRHHDAVRALGAIPLDYRDPDLPGRVRALAPGGVDAVFDHIGGEGILDSYRLLARGGTLVSYGTAATRDIPGSSRAPVLKLLARLTLWNLLPNGRGHTSSTSGPDGDAWPPIRRASAPIWGTCWRCWRAARSPQWWRRGFRSPMPRRRCGWPSPAPSPEKWSWSRTRAPAGTARRARDECRALRRIHGSWIPDPAAGP